MHTPVVLIENTVDKYIAGVKYMHTPVVLIDNKADKLCQNLVL